MQDVADTNKHTLCLQKTHRLLFLKIAASTAKDVRVTVNFHVKLEATASVSMFVYELQAWKVFQFCKIEHNILRVALGWFTEHVWLLNSSNTHTLFPLHPLGNRETPLFSNSRNTKKTMRVYFLLVHSNLYKWCPTLCSNKDLECSFPIWKSVSWKFINRGKHWASGEHILRIPLPMLFPF